MGRGGYAKRTYFSLLWVEDSPEYCEGTLLKKGEVFRGGNEYQQGIKIFRYQAQLFLLQKKFQTQLKKNLILPT